MIKPAFLFICMYNLPVSALSLPRTCVQKIAVALSLVNRVGIQSITMSATRWKGEKERILSLSIEEKRKLYKSPDYVTPEAVKPWSQYALEHDISSRQATADDDQEFQKINIDGQLNKALAEKVAIFKGDITKLEVDAIVNAANSHLRAGGGVDGAIHRAAGPLLQEECFMLVGCPTGEAKITCGYNLPAKHVIQTVGPQDKSAPKLYSCYTNCLALLPQYNIKTIAFPCISTGIYGFPNRLAAHIALQTARKTLEQDAKDKKLVEKIIFCTFMPVDVEIYESLMKLYFPIE